MTQEQPERDETILKKLSRLFVQAPEAVDSAAATEELRVHGVDVERLSRRIREIVQSAAEKERLAWLEAYEQRGARPRLRGRTLDLPPTRAERIRMIDALQRRAAERGLSTAVGFKKLNLEALSDEDLGRIIDALLEDDESEEGPGS
jgi:hypothetical protein